MPLTATCIARYRADAGVFSDAGITHAIPSDRVYQWTDLTGNGHHLIQTDAAYRPVYSSSLPGQSSSHPAISFDGSNTLLNLPSSLNLPGSGCAVLLCSRGTGAAIVTLGVGASFSYGFVTGSPGDMAISDGSIHRFPRQTYLPTLTPTAHGFRSLPAITRLCVGTNQTSDLGYDTSIFNSSGGSIGSLFEGDLFELAIYSPAPDDSTLQQLLQNLQDCNGITAGANTTQIIFIGDANMGQCPQFVRGTYGDAIKPLVLARSTDTVADQLSIVNAQLPTLDNDPFSQTIAIVCAGTTDLANGRTDAQITADLATLCRTLQSLQMNVMIATAPDPAMSGVNALLQNNYAGFADALVNWAADPRLSDATNTPLANDSIKASLLEAQLLLLMNPPPPVYQLNYASFYSAGQTFAGSFGHFAQS